MPLSPSPREYTTTTRRSRVIPRERELRGLGHAVGSRDPPSFSPARIVRGGGRARARRSARSHGRYAVDPRAAAAAARNRVNASPVVLLVHLGRRPVRRETAGLSPPPSSWIGSSTIRRGFGGAASRARSSRANVQRSLVRARQVRRRASSLWLLKRPSARRGPGIVSVDRNVRSKCRCSCVLQFTS